MPVVDITLVRGRSRAVKEALYADITDALCRRLDCTPAQVRIKINEVEAVDYAVGGVSALTLAERGTPLAPPAEQEG